MVNGILALATMSIAALMSTATLLPMWGESTAESAVPLDDDSHQPANKVSVASSSFEVLSAPVVEGATSEIHTLLGATFKTSKPTDLVLQVALECALWTDVSVEGNGDSSAVASVKVWIEYDGVTLPVASDEDPASPDMGRVVFCNRAYRFTVTDLDDEDARFEQFLRTRAANGFNWVRIDAGSGLHTVEVKAQLEAEVTGVGMAQAGVGKRTLVVEPVRLANDAVL